MKPEYCEEPDCPACDLKRHLQHLLDADFPPEDLVEMTLAVLADVVEDDVRLIFGEMPGEGGTVH